MKNTTERRHQRHALTMAASLRGGKVTIVSISAGGCAIRTATHLKKGEKLTLDVPFFFEDTIRTIQVASEVVWSRNEYRIDTFYQHGLRFIEPLSEACLNEVLAEDTLSVSQIQNKIVA